MAVVAIVPFATAHGGTTTPQSVNVKASVASSCELAASETDVAFGAIPAFLATTQAASGSVTFTCNKGANVSVTVGNGNYHGLGQSASLRAMKSGASDYISYHVFRPTGATFSTCTGSTEWTTALNVKSLWTNAGGAHTIKLCGRVDAAPATGYAAGTSYADVIMVQATF